MHLCCVPALRHLLRYLLLYPVGLLTFLSFLDIKSLDSIFASNSCYFRPRFKLDQMDLARDRVQDHPARGIERLSAPVSLRDRVTTFT